METNSTNNLSPLQHLLDAYQVHDHEPTEEDLKAVVHKVIEITKLLRNDSVDLALCEAYRLYHFFAVRPFLVPGQEDILRQAERLVPIYKKHTDKSEA
jgi:hypothetical protein